MQRVQQVQQVPQVPLEQQARPEIQELLERLAQEPLEQPVQQVLLALRVLLPQLDLPLLMLPI